MALSDPQGNGQQCVIVDTMVTKRKHFHAVLDAHGACLWKDRTIGGIVDFLAAQEHHTPLPVVDPMGNLIATLQVATVKERRTWQK